jgi:hypothetical protein
MKKKWQFMGAQDIGEDPYLDRLRILATPWFSIYLHHIRREDYTAPHDHPWWFGSLVLSGGYIEYHYPDKSRQSVDVRTHGRFSWHTMSTRAKHAITHVERPLWTLVVTGPVTNPEWGFYPEGKFVPWQEYDEREEIVAGWPSWKQQGIIK